MIVLAGLGRMGGELAARMTGAGLQPRLYDVAPEPRLRFGVTASSLAEAATGCDLVLLCLPDAGAVRAAVDDLLGARPLPELVVDMTSSDPDVTRQLGRVLAGRGSRLIDAPLSGGVAGARDGRLTAMVGGSPDLLERVRPVLSTFASRIEWAGELGSGHALKAINNTLSAASLLATSRVVLTAALAGIPEFEAVVYFNHHRGRSQNSEVKFPRDILPRTYSAGFTVGLMIKDVGTAIRLGESAGKPTPATREIHAQLVDAARALGADEDFTRVYQLAKPVPAASLEALDEQLYNACLAAATELIGLVTALGLDRVRALEIINASTGRSQATLDLARISARQGGRRVAQRGDGHDKQR